jgi:hypothetical protein
MIKIVHQVIFVAKELIILLMIYYLLIHLVGLLLWYFILFYFILNKFRYINLVLLKDGLKFSNIYNLAIIFILGYLISVVFL